MRYFYRYLGTKVLSLPTNIPISYPFPGSRVSTSPLVILDIFAAQLHTISLTQLLLADWLPQRSKISWILFVDWLFNCCDTVITCCQVTKWHTERFSEIVSTNVCFLFSGLPPPIHMTITHGRRLLNKFLMLLTTCTFLMLVRIIRSVRL